MRYEAVSQSLIWLSEGDSLFSLDTLSTTQWRRTKITFVENLNVTVTPK